ncbi:MAG: hypothetical protein ACK44H_02475 [Candidatus Kryptonium sp.]
MKYIRKVENLKTGSSLGNFLLFARFDRETNLEGLWYSLDNKFYCGRWKIEFYVDAEKLKPTETIFEPFSQATKYLCGLRKFSITKKAFLPYVRIEHFEAKKDKLKKFFYVIEIVNNEDGEVNVLINHEIIIPAVDSPFFTKQPSVEEKKKRYKIVRKDEGSFEVEPFDLSGEKRFLISGINFYNTEVDDTKIEACQKVELGPGEKTEILFLYSIGEEGLNENIRELYDEVFKLSNEELGEVLNTSYVFTPNAVINSGFKWAKVNMCRVEHFYRSGFAFTNDPPQDIVVMRDLAWFVLGSDYVTPKFSHKIIEFALKYGVCKNGKVVEYVHADETDPKPYDYNLNMNDDTPLLIWALHHHSVLCDLSELRENYSQIKNIADYILSQLKDNLVFSNADGFGVYGITGWRNIIENYNLSGYVTEINSECIYALNLVSKISHYLCNKQDSLRYKYHVQSLRKNFYEKLISKLTGLPVLNIDANGVKHHDITGDLVFPLIFAVGDSLDEGEEFFSKGFDRDFKYKISRRLIQPDIWTEYGARTVSKLEKSYDPEFGFQLMGGIWPNLTAWIGFGVREFFPEKVGEALINIYRVIESENPSYYQNLVPGQFPERFHGESGISLGMTLSPWMPPTYVWLVIEGLWGFSFDFEKIRIKPSLPPEWSWLGLKNLPHRGSQIDAFILDKKLYISGVEIEKVKFDGEVIKIGKMTDEDIETYGDGKIFYLPFIDNMGEKFIFVGSDIGFNGKVKVDEKSFDVKLNPCEAKIIDLK